MKLSYLLATLLAAGVVACGKTEAPKPAPAPKVEPRSPSKRRSPPRPPSPRPPPAPRPMPPSRPMPLPTAARRSPAKADAKPAEAPKK